MPSREMRRSERAALEQPWRVERTREGHDAFYPPDRSRGFAIVSDTDVGLRKALAQMRRRGFV